MKIYCEKTVLPNASGLMIAPARVEVEGTSIVSVQKGSLEKIPHDTLHLKNKILSPAFVNSHTHLSMCLFRALDLASKAKGNMVKDAFFEIESKLRPEDVRAFTRLGAYESLSFGVACVWDHFYHGYSIAQGLADVGLTGVVSPTLQDLEGPAKDRWEKEWEHTESIMNSEAFKKKGIYAAWGPHATETVSEELWKKIAQASFKYKIPVHSHLAQSQEEVLKIKSRTSLSPVSFLDAQGLLESPSLVLAHGIYLTEQDLKTLKASKKLSLVFCPYSQAIFEFPANILSWEEHGLNWSLATDTVASNDSMNLQKELRALGAFPMQALSHSNVYDAFYKGQAFLKEIQEKRESLWECTEKLRSPEYLLSKVWSLPGSFHSQFKVGVVAENHLANLVVWDLEHPSLWPSEGLRALSFQDTSSAISNVMVAGQWKGKAGHFQESIVSSQEYQEALEEAKKRMRTIMLK